MRHYVLAHAVWLTDERLDALDDSQPNPIETRVLPTLVYCWRDDPEHNPPLKLATSMGWPGIYDFVYRHNWWKSVLTHRDDEAIHVGTDQYVNGWLYLLLNLDTPEAKEFRNRENWSRPFDVADKVVKGTTHASVDLDRLGFLFMDPELGRQCLAVRHWPRFLKATQSIQPNNNGFWGLYSRTKYLALTEPDATLEMYREALEVTTGQLSWIPIEVLKNLPLQRQEEIAEVWIGQLREIAANPPKVKHAWMDPEKINGLIQGLERRLKSIRRERGK